MGQGPSTLARGLSESEIELCEISAEFVFVVPFSSMLGFLSLPLYWVSFAFSFQHMSFHQVVLFLCLVSASWGQPEVVSARLNPSQSSGYVGGVCNYHHSVWLQQRFGTPDQCYSSVTAQLQLSFIWKHGIVHPPGMRAGWPKKEGLSLDSSFYMFCLLPLNLPYANCASQEGSLFHLGFSLQSLDFLLFQFHRLFPFFVF